MTRKLAIAIPTYNRAEILKYNLLQIIDELINHEVPVYISDDSTNDDTQIMVEDLKKIYPGIYYFKNNPNLGHDLNCLSTISLPKEDYVWYIGDSMIIKDDALKEILLIIDEGDYDFISFNAESRNFHLDNQIYFDANLLFSELCWHLTMTGTTIYNKRKLIDLNEFSSCKFRNFPQTAIIFEHFSQKKSSLFWLNKSLIYGNPNKSSYWFKKVFEVFLDDFKALAFNLPSSYSIKLKEKVIRDHSTMSGIFSYKNVIKYRLGKAYDYKVYKKYNKDLKKYTYLNIPFMFVLSVLPIWILGFFNKLLIKK